MIRNKYIKQILNISSDIKLLLYSKFNTGNYISNHQKTDYLIKNRIISYKVNGIYLRTTNHFIKEYKEYKYNNEINYNKVFSIGVNNCVVHMLPTLTYLLHKKDKTLVVKFRKVNYKRFGIKLHLYEK